MLSEVLEPGTNKQTVQYETILMCRVLNVEFAMKKGDRLTSLSSSI